MKLFTKICLIVAAVAAGLGMMGIVLGVMMGAGIGDMRNINLQPYYEAHHTAENNGWGTGDVYLLDILAGGFNLLEDEVLKDTVYEINDIKNLEMEIEAGTITIHYSPTETNLVCYSNKDDVLTREENGTIIIEDHNQRTPLELEIYLPSELEKIDMELGACEVYIEKLKADDISIDLGVGSMTIDAIAAEKNVELIVGTGEMKVGYFNGFHTCNLDLECGVGSLEIVLRGDKTKYNYALTCGIGSIQLGENSYSGLGGATKFDNGAESFVEAECGIGEIILDFTE